MAIRMFRWRCSIAAPTPLLCACRHGHTETALAVMERAATQAVLGDGHRWALHVACFYGNTGTTIALIERGADVSSKNPFLHTPLHVACEANRVETALAIVERGADICAEDLMGQTHADISPGFRSRIYERQHAATVRLHTTWL